MVDESDSAGFERGTRLREVAADPQRYLGQRVTVSGEVGEILRAVRLEGAGGAPQDAADGDVGVADADVGDPDAPNRGPAAADEGLAPREVFPNANVPAFTMGDDDLLVVAADGEIGPLREDGVVQVTGTVRRFDVDRFNSVFGTEVFADERLDGFAGRPALVATAIDPTLTADDVAGA